MAYACESIYMIPPPQKQTHNKSEDMHYKSHYNAERAIANLYWDQLVEMVNKRKEIDLAKAPTSKSSKMVKWT